MTKQSFIFTKENKEQWPQMKESFQALQQALISGQGGFELSIGEIKKDKRYKQLRGFHRLLDILVPYFVGWTGEIWDQSKVKEFIKKKADFTIKYHNIVVVKSCKEASLEEMSVLIKEVEKFAAEMGVEDCFLKSDELRDLEEYYG